jgi:shikimate dehydrogenase
MRGLYCLLGDPVAHSRSPAIHARAFHLLAVDAVYAPCRVAVAELPAAVAGLRALGAKGFNVTVPHKGELVRLVDWVSKDAERMGAVNCVSRAPDGQLLGHNTDAPGLLRALRGVPEGTRTDVPEGARTNVVELAGARAAVVGAGGSARAAALALAGQAHSIAIVNRTESKARALAALCRAAGCPDASARPLEDALRSASLVVHCTTVGLGTDELPFDPALLARGAVLVDLVYAPQGPTALVRRARSLGLRAIDGLDVLVHQAIASLEIWLGRPQLDALFPQLREAALA